MRTIYILKVFDPWDEYIPWDIVGYVETKKEADEWKAKTISPSSRRIEEVFYINNEK